MLEERLATDLGLELGDLAFQAFEALRERHRAFRHRRGGGWRRALLAKNSTDVMGVEILLRPTT
jgi:hypothetical protein